MLVLKPCRNELCFQQIRLSLTSRKIPGWQSFQLTNCLQTRQSQRQPQRRWSVQPVPQIVFPSVTFLPPHNHCPDKQRSHHNLRKRRRLSHPGDTGIKTKHCDEVAQTVDRRRDQCRLQRRVRILSRQVRGLHHCARDCRWKC